MRKRVRNVPMCDNTPLPIDPAAGLRRPSNSHGATASDGWSNRRDHGRRDGYSAYPIPHCGEPDTQTLMLGITTNEALNNG